MTTTHYSLLNPITYKHNLNKVIALSSSVDVDAVMQKNGLKNWTVFGTLKQLLFSSRAIELCLNYLCLALTCICISAAVKKEGITSSSLNVLFSTDSPLKMTPFSEEGDADSSVDITNDETFKFISFSLLVLSTMVFRVLESTRKNIAANGLAIRLQLETATAVPIAENHSLDDVESAASVKLLAMKMVGGYAGLSGKTSFDELAETLVLCLTIGSTFFDIVELLSLTNANYPIVPFLYMASVCLVFKNSADTLLNACGAYQGCIAKGVGEIVDSEELILLELKKIQNGLNTGTIILPKTLSCLIYREKLAQIHSAQPDSGFKLDWVITEENLTHQLSAEIDAELKKIIEQPPVGLSADSRLRLDRLLKLGPSLINPPDADPYIDFTINLLLTLLVIGPQQFSFDGTDSTETALNSLGAFVNGGSLIMKTASTSPYVRKTLVKLLSTLLKQHTNEREMDPIRYMDYLATVSLLLGVCNSISIIYLPALSHFFANIKTALNCYFLLQHNRLEESGVKNVLRDFCEKNPELSQDDIRAILTPTVLQDRLITEV